MWFDPWKLLANANFQDGIELPSAASNEPTYTADAGGNLIPPATQPLSSLPGVGPTVAPPDALSLAGAPAQFPGTSGAAGANAFNLGGIAMTEASAGADPFGGGAVDTGAGPATDNVPLPQPRPPGADTTPAAPAAKTDTGYSSEVDKVTGATPGRAAQPGTATLQPTAGTVGGAAGANAMANLAKALQGVAQAAQGGNPQAMQLMNMLRQMQMMQGMGGMMGGMGGQYNPYMNQFNNPWAARHRMEQMRREFMERQRARAQIYGHTPGGGTFGGGRGRGR